MIEERFRSGFRNLMLVLASILGALLIGEAVLQIIYLRQNGQWLWENSSFRIGYTQPVADRRQYSLRQGYRDQKAGITVDQMGFRKTQPSGDPHRPVVVCLGDSVPFGAGVRDDETYPAYLAQLLSSKGFAVSVLNAAVPSYNLRQSFDRLPMDVTAHYSLPRIALVAVNAANDISLLTYYGANWNPDLTWADVRWSGTWNTRPHYQKLATVYYLSDLIREANAGEVRSHRASQALNQASQTDQKTAMLNQVKRVLEGELAFYRTHAIPVLLMPINPFYYQRSGQERNPQLRDWQRFKGYVEDWDDLISAYNDVLIEVTQRFDNTYFFDTRLVMDGQNRDEMYIDYIHHSPEGNRALAEAFFNFLIRHQLLSEGVVGKA